MEVTFYYEKLTPEHREIITGLQTYEKELYKFLIEDALDNQEMNISATYLWFLKKTDELIGYVTILTDAISLNDSMKKSFKKINVPYKSLPAIKIGRLCVDNRHQRKGYGKKMVMFTFNIAISINDDVGCRYVTLDAKRNKDPAKDSLHFYKHIGFSILRERSKGTTAMYYDLDPIIRIMNDKNNE